MFAVAGDVVLKGLDAIVETNIFVHICSSQQEALSPQVGIYHRREEGGDISHSAALLGST